MQGQPLSQPPTATAPTAQPQDVVGEVEILYHLGGHPHVVQLFEVFEDRDDIHLVLVGWQAVGCWGVQRLAGRCRWRAPGVG